MSDTTSPITSSNFRLMTYDDLPRVMEIENVAHYSPWTSGTFKDCLRVGYLCRVLEVGNIMYGYTVISFGAGEAHVLTIAVDPKRQRQGYGRLLMGQLLEDVGKLDVDTLLLEVRASNLSAIALYDSFGFNEIAVRKKYYPAKNGREDALMFARVML